MSEQDALELRQIKIELRAVNNFNATRMTALIERVERLRNHLPPAVFIEEIFKLMEEEKATAQFVRAWKAGMEMRLDELEKRIT